MVRALSTSAAMPAAPSDKENFPPRVSQEFADVLRDARSVHNNSFHCQRGHSLNSSNVSLKKAREIAESNRWFGVTFSGIQNKWNEESRDDVRRDATTRHFVDRLYVLCATHVTLVNFSLTRPERKKFFYSVQSEIPDKGQLSEASPKKLPLYLPSFAEALFFGSYTR